MHPFTTKPYDFGPGDFSAGCPRHALRPDMELARNHVGGHGPPAVEKQSILIEAADRKDRHMYGLAEIVVLHTEGDRLRDRTTAADQVRSS